MGLPGNIQGQALIMKGEKTQEMVLVIRLNTPSVLNGRLRANRLLSLWGVKLIPAQEKSNFTDFSEASWVKTKWTKDVSDV